MKIIQEFNSEEYDKLFELEKQCERFLCFKFQDLIIRGEKNQSNKRLYKRKIFKEISYMVDR